MKKNSLIHKKKSYNPIENFLKKEMFKNLSFFYPKLKKKKIKYLVKKTTINNIKKSWVKKSFFSKTKVKIRNLSNKNFNKNLLKNTSFIRLDSRNKNIRSIILINITPNNSIITLTNKKGEIQKVISSGNLGLKSSKKNYKVIYNLVINELISVLKKNKNKKYILFRFNVPKIIRRKVLRRFKFYSRISNIFEVSRLLPFNGCRPPKMRRKKRKGLRILKPSF